jgi:hypothetical protein
MVIAAVYYGFSFGHVMSIFQMLDGGRYSTREERNNTLRGGCNGAGFAISSSPQTYDCNRCTQGKGENQCKKGFDSYPNGNSLEALGTNVRVCRRKRERRFTD